MRKNEIEGGREREREREEMREIVKKKKGEKNRVRNIDAIMFGFNIFLFYFLFPFYPRYFKSLTHFLSSFFFLFS